MPKKYRTKLTDEEYNAISNLTSAIHADEEFDIEDRGTTDKFRDFEDDELKSLRWGLVLLYDMLAYPLSHEGISDNEAQALCNLFVEFDICSEEQTEWLLEK